MNSLPQAGSVRLVKSHSLPFGDFASRKDPTISETDLREGPILGAPATVRTGAATIICSGPRELFDANEQAAESSVKVSESPLPQLKVETKDGKSVDSIDPPKPYFVLALLGDAIGAHDLGLFSGIVNQLNEVPAKNGELNADDLNFPLAAMKEIAPRDAVETMLASQMAVSQMATMTLGRRLSQFETIPQQDSAGRAFNKLARTFTTQIEALRKYRTGGRRKSRSSMSR